MLWIKNVKWSAIKVKDAIFYERLLYVLINLVLLPPKLYLVDFSSDPARFEQAHLFMTRVQKSAKIFWEFVWIFCNTCPYPLGEIVKNVLA